MLLVYAIAVTACTAGTAPRTYAPSPAINGTRTPAEVSSTVNSGTKTPVLATETAAAFFSGLPACSNPDVPALAAMELAFVADWDGDWEVYKIRADGSQLTQLTDNSTADSDPVWSPDGAQIAFELDVFHPRLYVVQADGSGDSSIGPDFDAFSPAWSPLGDQIAFLDFDDQDIDDLFVVNAATGDVRRITEGTDVKPGAPNFSPDGSLLAFTGGVPGREPGHGLFTINPDGTGLKEVGLPHEVIYSFMWHPFNNEIVYDAWSREEAGFYLATLEGTVTRLPIAPDSRGSSPEWSPDGSLIGYIADAPRLDSSGALINRASLHVATPDGQTDVALLEPPRDQSTPFLISNFAWAPDGRYVAYAVGARGSSQADLYVLDVCDGTSTLVVEAIRASSPPSWRPLP